MKLIKLDSMRLKRDHKDLSDIQLFNLTKADDEHAFKEIFKRFCSPLTNFSYRKISDRALAEDLVYDVFASLWENRHNDLAVTQFESFIFTLVKNKIIDHIRRQKVSQRYIDNFSGFLSIEDNADYLVRHKDMLDLIEKEIAALPEKMRRIFELSRKTNMSRKQIAEHLDIPEGNVKINIERALKALKSKFGNSLTL